MPSLTEAVAPVL